FHLVGLRGARLDPDRVEWLRRCRAILDRWETGRPNERSHGRGSGSPPGAPRLAGPYVRAVTQTTRLAGCAPRTTGISRGPRSALRSSCALAGRRVRSDERSSGGSWLIRATRSCTK